MSGFSPADLLARTDLFVAGEPGAATALLASTCPDCRRTAFPRTVRCLACGSSTDPSQLAGPARLDFRTTVTSPPPGALIAAPYDVGVATFPEAGLCVIGLLAGPVDVGDDVAVVVIEPYPGGRTFAFRATANPTRSTT